MIDVLFLIAGLALTFWILRHHLSLGRCLWIFCFIFHGSLGFYLMNYLTGYPFGELMVSLPFKATMISSFHWSLPFWWIILLINAYIIVSVILVHEQKEFVQENRFLIALLTGVIIAMVHATWEPIAVNHRAYWFWLDRDRGYYGTPRLNLVGWHVVGVLLSFLIAKSMSPAIWKTSNAWKSLALLGMIELYLGYLNWKSQFFIPVFIALNLTGILAGALLISDGYWKKSNPEQSKQ